MPLELRNHENFTSGTVALLFEQGECLCSTRFLFAIEVPFTVFNFISLQVETSLLSTNKYKRG
jgi:hypothetical protein